MKILILENQNIKIWLSFMDRFLNWQNKTEILKDFKYKMECSASLQSVEAKDSAKKVNLSSTSL